MAEDSVINEIETISSKAPFDVDAKRKLEEEEKLAYIDSYKQDTKERKHYAEKTFEFLCFYMFAVFLILVFVGSDHIDFHFSDSVVIALITTTTANVIGIFIFVMRYLFNGNKRK